MALEETPLDESTTPLPPQAGGQSLPGQAADLADIAPASDFETELLRARLGEKGAQQYQDLRTAGQQASTPATPTPTPAPAAAPPAGPMANLAGTAPAGAAGVPQGGFNPLYTLLAGQGAEQQIVARNLQLQHAQNELEAQNIDFLDKLQKEPLNVRAGMIHSWAARQGRDVTPQEAQYIASVSPEAMEHSITMARNGDPTALATLKSLLGGNPIDMLTAKQTIEAREAAASKATTEAAWTEPMAEAKYAETMAKADKERSPVEPKTTYQGQRLAAIDALKKQGVASPTESQIAKGVEALQASQAGATAAERQAATETATTRTMKETAPKVRDLVQETAAALNRIKSGPVGRRWEEAWAGKFGANDPDFKKLRDNAQLLSSLLGRMHYGARGAGQQVQDFKDMIGAGKQSIGNMESTLTTIDRYADIVTRKREGEPIRGIGTHDNPLVPDHKPLPGEIPSGAWVMAPNGTIGQAP